jgi:hypothetical protein
VSLYFSSSPTCGCGIINEATTQRIQVGTRGWVSTFDRPTVGGGARYDDASGCISLDDEVDGDDIKEETRRVGGFQAHFEIEDRGTSSSRQMEHVYQRLCIADSKLTHGDPRAHLRPCQGYRHPHPRSRHSRQQAVAGYRYQPSIVMEYPLQPDEDPRDKTLHTPCKAITASHPDRRIARLPSAVPTSPSIPQGL